jgi:hypothetical protein
MKTTHTLSIDPLFMEWSTIRSRLLAAWPVGRKPRSRIHSEHGRRYAMRHEDLLRSPVSDDFRRSWWL